MTLLFAGRGGGCFPNSGIPCADIDKGHWLEISDPGCLVDGELWNNFVIPGACPIYLQRATASGFDQGGQEFEILICWDTSPVKFQGALVNVTAQVGFSGGDALVRMRLVEGTTIRAERIVAFSLNPSVVSFALTDAERDSIGDWDDLRIRISFQQVTIFTTNRFFVYNESILLSCP